MSRYQFFLRIGFPILTVIIFLAGCTSSGNLGMEPATITFQDTFTCKGLSEDNRWIGVTDEFIPGTDPYVVVVAQLDKNDLKKRIFYELVNPNNRVVLSETKNELKQNPLGVFFPLTDLMERGGEGEWKANVFADGDPVAQAVFHVGEKPEEDEKTDGPTFFVVGSDSADEGDDLFETISDEDRFGSYIREVTPALSLPVPDEPESAAIEIEQATS